MSDLVLGLRMLGRSLRAGELTLLLAALVLAVASMATVGLFTERMRLALDREANRLLGADVVLSADRPVPEAFVAEAAQRGLEVSATWGFRSMAGHEDRAVLSEVTAVADGYPLRGTSRIAPRRGAAAVAAADIPAPGTIWADERLLSRLGVATGARVAIGDRSFEIAAVLDQDPSMTLSFLGLGPRVVMRLDDVASTGLIQPGSRVRYRLLLAGDPQSTAAYRAWAAPVLAKGQRLEGVGDARPEIRSALERAQRFMGLAALAAVALAAVAVLLAARRLQERRLQSAAMLRCLGASRGRVLRLEGVAVLGAGSLGAGLGALAGYAGQAGLATWLEGLLDISLPAPGFLPAVQAGALGLVLLLAFALPPIVALRRVPPVRVLRQDAGGPRASGLAAYASGIAAIVLLVLWQAQDARLGLYVIAGSLGTLALAASITALMLLALGRLRASTGVSWRYGIASLRRRPAATYWQIMALALGLMAMLTLTLIRSDLVRAWEASLPADAPNRFAINIQPDQVEGIAAFLRERGVSAPTLQPMVRARLVAIDGRPVLSEAFTDERARRLVEREFNLSWSAELQGDNRIVAGRWWQPGERDRAVLSVEDGIAQTLGIGLGSVLAYDIAGVRVEASVSNLRRVDWDSMRANFFVLAPPGLLDGQPATYITSFHMPLGSTDLHVELAQRYPNVILIDVAAIMTQVQTMIAQVSQAVQFVFGFTLLAGLLVLYAGISATHDERVREAAVMRTLGARRAQIARAHAAEFAVIGALAGLLAAAGASGLGHFVGSRLLNLPYDPGLWIWAVGLLAGSILVLTAGMFFTRRVLRTPPLTSLREVG